MPPFISPTQAKCDIHTASLPWEKRARALMCKWANCVDQEATTDEEYDSDDENVVVSNLA